jgi:protein unc-119
MVTKSDCNSAIEEVKGLKTYTDKFLCKITDNTYNIKFINFRVRDLDSGFVLFEVKDEGEDIQIQEQEIEDSVRVIKYHLGPDFLDLKNIGTLLKFSVGSTPVKDFVLIERHYFKDQLIKSFEFKFDFCMPNSINEWETMYEIPELDPELKQKMIDFPWETRSDSFYFVEGKMIIHNKAIYNYSTLD